MNSPALSISLGVIIRRTSASSPWARHTWKAVAVIPGAGAANWRELRREGDAVEYHAATLPLELWPAETEAYLAGISAQTPAIGVVMREAEVDDAAAAAPRDGTSIPFEVVLVTASPYEAQDYADPGEDVVELVPMPPALVALVRDFCAEHHVEQGFVKRRRSDHRHGPANGTNGTGTRGDPRIHQASDVFRAPRQARRGRVCG